MIKTRALHIQQILEKIRKKRVDYLPIIVLYRCEINYFGIDL